MNIWPEISLPMKRFILPELTRQRVCGVWFWSWLDLSDTFEIYVHAAAIGYTMRSSGEHIMLCGWRFYRHLIMASTAPASAEDPCGLRCIFVPGRQPAAPVIDTKYFRFLDDVLGWRVESGLWPPSHAIKEQLLREVAELLQDAGFPADVSADVCAFLHMPADYAGRYLELLGPGALRSRVKPEHLALGAP